LFPGAALFHSARNFNSIKILLFAFASLLASAKAFAVETNVGRKHVILISVDGLGAKLLDSAKMPETKKIAAAGQSAPSVTTTRPVATIPGHVSMASAVTPEVHKSVWNENDDKLTPVDVPTIFDLVTDNGLTSVFITGKAKLKKVFEKHPPTQSVLPHSFLLGDAYGRLPKVVDQEAAKALDTKPNFLFIHYALADTVGHIFGWESWPQKRALEQIDKSIARVVTKADEVFGVGHYVLIITADHGGHEASHGRTNDDGSLQDPEHDLYIPWILSGAKLKPDLKSMNIIDTSPSIAALLDLKVPTQWHWQGASVVESQ
jgi:predicted AlkP superfamily pyrophosphatase or phosphodiesterase